MPHTEHAAALLAHLDALYNLAMWLTRDAREAQALVQVTLRQALSMALDSIPGTKLRVRLLTVMWEIYRRQHTVPPDGFGPEAAEQAPSEKRSLLRTLSRADLDAALRQLPDALRATVILSDMEGYAVEEVAAILGSTRERVQTALMQARRLLSQVLQSRLTSAQAWPAAEGEDSR
jgi:RNA polymerase sigma-70 factor (ECF subfamily)